METTFKLIQDEEWKEYQVQVFEDGILNKEKTYHTNLLQDAIDTRTMMQEELSQKEKGTLEELSDDDNPEYLFTGINTSILLKIIKKEIDPLELARKEIINRGLDSNGLWVGFEKSDDIINRGIYIL